MGAQMWAGDMELAYSRACWFINRWSRGFNDKKPSKDPFEDMGVFDFSETCVKKMDAAIPQHFDINFIDEDDLKKYDASVLKNAWESARLFLKYAADKDVGISGSY